jgi:predicted DNA-binding protein with PD1-like motif
MKFTPTEFGYVVRLEPGEEIIASLSRFVKARGIGTAGISGIGAAGELTIGYFDRARKQYVNRNLSGEYEILSLSGNVSHFAGEPWIHVHAVVAGPDFVATGGHLFSAKVTVTVELALVVSGERIERKEDTASGFRPLELEQSM